MAPIKVHGSKISPNVMRVFAALYEKDLEFEFVPVNLRIVFQEPKKMAILSVWMEVEGQQFDAPGVKLAWELAFKPMFGMVTDNAVVEEHEAKLAKVLDVYEARLTHSKYLGGDSFTLADLHHLPVTKFLMGTRASKLFESRPHVNAWLADIQARPSWQKVLAM